MEEVDQTIIPILQDVGCNFHDKNSISEFGTDEIVQACSHALYAINHEMKFPTKLPPGNAARFRICTQLSTAITELGFTGETGYQAFLYPNEKDMRKLLIWLIDKLPKSAEGDEIEEVVGADAMLDHMISQKLKSWMTETWSPLPAQPDVQPGFQTTRLHLPSVTTDEATNTYFQDIQPLVNCIPSTPSQYIPSLLETHSREVLDAHEREQEWEAGNAQERQQQRRKAIGGLVQEAFHIASSESKQGESLLEMMNDYRKQQAESSRISRRTEFEQEKEAAQAQVVEEDGTVTNVTEDGVVQEEDEDAIRQKHEEEVGALKSKLKAMEEKTRELEHLSEQIVAGSRMVEMEFANMGQATKGLEQTYKVKKRTLDLLPQAEDNLKKLREISAASAERLVQLGQEWESHRGPLIAKYRRRKQMMQDRKDEARTKLEQIKIMRADMKHMAQDVRDKDVQYRQAVEELNRLPKSINRQVYVRRIMDIVKNLDKQKADITRVLSDVRSVQKDINMVSETSKRSFAVADETIFQAASKSNGPKKDPAATQSYKLLHNLQSLFEKLFQTVESMGKTKNEIRDLSSRIEAIESRNTNLNMERIKEDLSAVKGENATLTAQLQEAMKAAQK